MSVEIESWDGSAKTVPREIEIWMELCIVTFSECYTAFNEMIYLFANEYLIYVKKIGRACAACEWGIRTSFCCVVLNDRVHATAGKSVSRI